MIRILDSFVADKIAAGEVIERPVSIVKELVENSIDASASSIIVEIRNGGKSYIRITDDGSGIPSEEVSIAFERHATSKLSKLDDLNHIMSLGFRGEALASISAISRLTIYTRIQQSNSGTKLVINGGHILSNEIVGTNPGTTMIVEDVFYNVPARRKFLGTDAKEAAAIIELVQNFAIYYSNIKFMLINNGLTILTTSGDSDTLSVIKTINPTHEYDKLIQIKTERITGFISNPSITKSSRRGQLFFVNGRPVKSNIIEKGIEKGYGNRIFSGYPIVFLFINIDPTCIDVNVHPGKREIKFLNQDLLINDIAKAIEDALSYVAPIPQFKPVSYTNFTLENAEQIKNTTSEKNEYSSDIREYLNFKMHEENNDNLDEEHQLPNIEIPNSSSKKNFSEIYSEVNLDNKLNNYFSFDNLEYCGYLFNTYILMSKENAVYVFDQHAAHERIFYERLVSNYSNKKIIPQPILTPITINVSPDIYSLDRTWIDIALDIGFDIDDFGNNTFIIRGVPTYMDLSEANSFINTFIDSLTDVDSFSVNNQVIDKLITKSCKSAVKANEKLSIIEINDLIKELSKCKNPYSCPHGRPTFINISKYEIEKLFRRK